MIEPYPSSAPRRIAQFSFDRQYHEIRSRCFHQALSWKCIPAALETEDLVQEALVKIWEASPRFEQARSPWPLVKVIANNAFKDACQRYGKYQSISIESFDIEVLGQTLESETTPSNVNALLDFLTSRQKEIIKMSFGIDQPAAYGINEIAEELGITRQTVSSDKKKGLKVMEECHCQRKASKRMAL